MKKKLFVSLFLSISLICFSQNSRDLVLNNLIYKTSVQNRNIIKNFILSKGKTKYYNSSYGNCPFYQFNNIDAYLLPVDSLKKKSEEYTNFEFKENTKPESEKYALSLKYNNQDIPSQPTNTSSITKIRSDIDYILKVAKNK